MLFRVQFCHVLTGLASLFLQVHADGDATDFSSRCLSFRPEQYIANSTRTALQYVTNGTTLLFPGNVASCARPSQLVSANLCRIALSIPTSNRSSTTFELWLPDNWSNTRYVSTGNGGIDGCIKYEDLAYASLNGFAAMGTNNGHNGTTGVTMLNNPDIIEDFAYRALHTGTSAGQLLTEKYYQKKYSYSYYLGCSLGGRMGIKAAEMYPDDYDGIVAGCPAVDFNHLQGWRAEFYPITGAIGSENFINASLWTGLIHNEVLKQCDLLDGVADGIIEDPSKCFFNPTTLLCDEICGQDGFEEEDETAWAAGKCLNEAQVQQIERAYAPYTYANGTLIFPRMNPGNEIDTVLKFFAGAPFSYSEDWFRYVVFNNASWDPATYDLEDVSDAEILNPFNIKTYPQTLPSFKQKGGKMISYHGGQDNQITSFNTARFYDQMSEADRNLDNWYRFFRVSGMFHCNSGPGAWVLGQGGGAPAAGIPFEADQNVFAAIVQWVEKGVAPTGLTGTKFVNDTVSLGIDFQRTHCQYPKEQTYIGGNYKLPSSWRCL